MKLRRGGRHRVEDRALLAAGRVTDHHLEHEPVELGLGERVGSLLLERVLGGEDKEGIGKLEGLVTDRDLTLLHRLEQRALDLGGGAVDLVGQDEVREDGALPCGEDPLAGIVDQGADEISREKVGRELDAGEIRMDAGGEGADGQGLGQAGHALEEDVAVAEEADQETPDESLLAYHDAAHLLGEGLDPGTGLLDTTIEFLDGWVHKVCFGNDVESEIGAADVCIGRRFSDTRKATAFNFCQRAPRLTMRSRSRRARSLAAPISPRSVA